MRCVLDPMLTCVPNNSRTDILDEDQRQAMASAIPLGRMCTARDVANAVAYLASDDADFITGVNFQVRGDLSSVCQTSERRGQELVS